MAKLSIKILPLIGIILLLSVIGYFLMKSDRGGPGEKSPDEITNDETTPAADISGKKFKVIQDDPDKGITWTLEADKFSYLDQGGDDEVILLETFRINYHQQDGLDLELKGKNGKYNARKEIDLSGDIQGKTSSGYMFNTEHITFQHKENCLKTDETVTLIGPYFKTTGRGLFVDLEKETFEILKDIISVFNKESLTI